MPLLFNLCWIRWYQMGGHYWYHTRAWWPFRWDSKCRNSGNMIFTGDNSLGLWRGDQGYSKTLKLITATITQGTKKIESWWGSTRILGTGRMSAIYVASSHVEYVLTDLYSWAFTRLRQSLYGSSERKVRKPPTRSWELFNLRIHLHFQPCGLQLHNG